MFAPSSYRHRLKLLSATLTALCLPIWTQVAGAQAVTTFGGNAQHTSIYQPAARNLNQILWSTQNDLSKSGFAHYGAPLVTASNTVILPVKTAGNSFQISAFDGSNKGAAKYTLLTDYILPSSSWIPVYQPALATVGGTTRLYYPGAGGTVLSIDNPDSASPSSAVRTAFFGNGNYQMNPAAFNSTVFINTPITPDSSGNIYFGFRVQGTAPAPLSSTQSGFARIDAAGNTTYVLVGAAAGNDPAIIYDSHNSAPALSNDGSTLYVVVKSSSELYGYLLALNSTTLATKSKVLLKDPRSGRVNNAQISDISTASPTVAPDGDVYFGVLGNPSNGSRGFMLRFNSDLSVEKTPGGFGWDYTTAIVPASMAPLYTGSSSYLIFVKYNNYAFADGDGINRIALLDPNTTQIDPHTSASGLVEMREVLTGIGPTPDPDHSTLPNAVREWCIDTAAVNPATNSIFIPNEDGRFYRWNLATNSLSQVVTLGQGVGQPYVPSVIGPDGTIYTLNGGTMFALGEPPTVRVTVATAPSATADLRKFTQGQSVTFTATVANPNAGGPVPTGSVTFLDTVNFLSGTTLNSSTTALGTVQLDASGNATLTTSLLTAANHYIAVNYTGNFGNGNATMVQKVHAFATSTTVTSTPSPSSPGQAVTFTATVAPLPPGGATPTGMMTFTEGVVVLAQVPLGAGGTATFSTSSLSAGSHTISATYASDTAYSASTGDRTHLVQAGPAATTTSLTSSANPAVFSQPVTLTAKVTANSPGGTPTGTVTFRDGNNDLGPGTLNGSGAATLSVPGFTVGTHLLTAVYGGDANFIGSGSSNLNQTVNIAPTTTSVVSSRDPSTVGQSVTFTATVTATAPATGKPSGTVTFIDKGKVLGTGNLDATGKATFTTSSLAQGAHQITASYATNGSFGGSVSPTVVQNVKK